MHFLQPFSCIYLFISPLPLTLISLFIFLYFCLFIFPSLTFLSSHYPQPQCHYSSFHSFSFILSLHIHTIFYKFVILSSIFCIVFHHRKVVSLSLTHTIIFGVFFFLASLLKLINFIVCYNSTLGWYDLVLCFKFFCSLWLLNIILLHNKKINLYITKIEA